MNNKLLKIQKILIFVPIIGFANGFICMYVYHKYTVKYLTLVWTVIKSIFCALPTCLIGAIILNNLELGIMYNIVNFLIVNFLMIYITIMIISAVCYCSQMQVLSKIEKKENNKND